MKKAAGHHRKSPHKVSSFFLTFWPLKFSDGRLGASLLYSGSGSTWADPRGGEVGEKEISCRWYYLAYTVAPFASQLSYSSAKTYQIVRANIDCNTLSPTARLKHAVFHLCPVVPTALLEFICRVFKFMYRAKKNFFLSEPRAPYFMWPLLT